jgi:hypothetical protein
LFRIVSEMHCKNPSRSRLQARLRNFALVAAIVSTLTCNLSPTVGAQTASQPLLTATEKREAQQLSITFTRRLGETLDFRHVVDELFVSDAAKRYVKEQQQRAAKFGTQEVTLSPGIFVDASLLEKTDPENWLRLYGAANNLLLLGLIRASLTRANFEELKVTDLYPAAVIDLLDADPLLRNFIEKKTELRPLKTAIEMRRAAATLEQANSMMRNSLPGRIDLEKTTIQMVMRDSSRKRPLSHKELRVGRAKMIEPRLEISDSEYFGFSRGTRMIWVSTFALMDLLLVREDGKLRVVWAQPIAD